MNEIYEDVHKKNIIMPNHIHLIIVIVYMAGELSSPLRCPVLEKFIFQYCYEVLSIF